MDPSVAARTPQRMRKLLRRLLGFRADRDAEGRDQRAMRDSVLGSIASRRESPSSVKPTTVSMIARPGTRTSRGSVAYHEMWSAIIPPHAGVGAGTPAPRYESVASNRTADATPRAP